MQDKIFGQLMNAFRSSTSAGPTECYALSLLILAWVKLSGLDALAPDLRLDREILDRGDKVKEALAAVCRIAGEDLKLPDGIRPALDLVLRLREAGLLQQIAMEDALISMDRAVDMAIPSDVADLLIQLAEIDCGESVYTPWDRGAQLSFRAVRAGAEVFWEAPRHSGHPGLMSILADRPFHYHVADPIQQPSEVAAGKLRKFDVAVSFLPFGQKYDLDVINRDWFERFPERTSSGAVLAIRHMLAQANRRIIVAVQNSIVFSTGVEENLRRDLVGKGIVAAVLNMPSGLLPFLNMSFVILVLDPRGGHQRIRFVDANSARFRAMTTKSKCRLLNPNDLVDLVLTEQEADEAATVPTAQVLEKDASLMVEQFVLDPKTKTLMEFMKTKTVVALKNLVETVRPMPTTTESDGAVKAWEVGAVDLPRYGYITRPLKGTYVPQGVAESRSEQFLRAFDIVLLIKGSTGKVGIVADGIPSPGPGGWIAGQSAIVLRMKEPRAVDPRALFMQLRSEVGQQLLSWVTSGASIPIIQLKSLLGLPVVLEKPEAAAELAERLDQEESLQDEIDRLTDAQRDMSMGIYTL